jgi:hypothetical protein
MRAKKLSRVIGFATVLAAMGGVGATAWAGTDEEAPAPAPAFVESPSPAPSLTPETPGPRLPQYPQRDYTWG